MGDPLSFQLLKKKLLVLALGKHGQKEHSKGSETRKKASSLPKDFKKKTKY